MGWETSNQHYWNIRCFCRHSCHAAPKCHKRAAEITHAYRYRRKSHDYS